MSASTNRAALINKLHKVAKKYYEPIKPPADRSVLDHMLYACCLEDSEYDAADEVFARLEQEYLNWNEVRVTTVNELAEIMKKLYNPQEAALRLRRTLHGMFETHYKFDIDFLKKENLGKAMQTMEKYRGISPFVVSYTAQAGLAGHSIPIDEALLNLLYIVGIISESEKEKRKIPGLSRVIAKAKGVEFASVVHQLAVAFHKSQFNKKIREIILEIAKDAKDRFPKRGDKKRAEEARLAAEKEAAEKAAAEKAAKLARSNARSKVKPKPAADAPKQSAAKVKASKKTKATKKATKAPAKKAAKKPAKKAAKKTTKKKTPAKKAPAKKKPTKKTKATKKVTKKSAKKKSPTKSLKKKKPR